MMVAGMIVVGSILIFTGLCYIMTEVGKVAVAIDELTGEIRRHD